MLADLLQPPLVRWDGLHVVLDLELVERHLVARLQAVDEVTELDLTGEGDAVRVTASVVWRGVRSRVALDVAEIRLKRRFLGFRVRRPRVLGGVPVPRAAVEAIVRRAGGDLVTVFRGQGIVVVDFRRWIPEEVDLAVLTVQATERSLHLWFGPGSLRDIPRPTPPALPATTTG